MNRELSHARLSATFLAFCLVYAIALCSLYRIQVLRGRFFKNLGHQQYRTLVTVPACRAPIYDRHDVPIAINKPCVSAFIVPAECSGDKAVVTLLERHFPAAAARLTRRPTDNFMFVKRRLSEHEREIIRLSGCAYIRLVNEESRYYPVASLASVVGLTDIDNRGICGVELECDTALRGRPSVAQCEKDARSEVFYFNKKMRHTGCDGRPVKLTIDANVQFLVNEELKETLASFDSSEGAILVMNPDNGDIIAMVSEPSFDPNDTRAIDISTTQNRVVTERYELGSVMKVFVALAALEAGVVTPDEVIDCKNCMSTYLCGRKITTVHENGRIPFWQVIAESNNIGIAIVAIRLGTSLYHHYVRMGFDRSTGVTLPGEQKGFVSAPPTWSKQSILSLSYGYEIAITLIELAQAFAMIARGGSLIQPRLIVEPAEETPVNVAPQKNIYSKKNIDIIRDILEKTATEGTAKRARIKGYRVMCKTGTANTLVNGTYTTKINLFTCAGIVQKGDYQRVIVTFIKAPGRKKLYAATVAVPLFERVAEKVLLNDHIF